jgi:anti-anti-sigma regulatory factor
LRDDFLRFGEIARGTVRLDLTAVPWVSGVLAGRVVALFRTVRGRGRLLVIAGRGAADFFRVTRLARVSEVWALDPDRIVARV